MISKIYHVSDQHIRLFKRHKEYELVFKRLFKYIEETKDENSVIFLGGDLVHSKTDMSPEMFALASRFLKNCADLCPTVLICGNHDTNLSNSHRLDALTPIVNSLNHPNLHYWKDSGVYKLNGVHFSVFSVFGSVEDWVLAKDIKGKYKIALHHGAVNGASTDIDHTIENTFVGVDKFDGFDLGLLGDVHKFQFLNEEKTIGYSSSLICQNYGEDPYNHGILVWDLKKRKAEFVPIKNDYGYFTFYVNEGNGIIPNDLPKNLRCRIKYENTTQEQLHDFVKKIGKKYSIIELIPVKVSGNVENINIPKTQLGNSRDIEYQNRLITEFLQGIEGVGEDEIDGVRHINRETNSILNTQFLIRNVTWVPIRFEFSNMFSYGEDNVVDFNTFNGIHGIFSPNQMGKSAFLDSLTFCIYDKATRASKAIHILNSNKSWFKCKFAFSLNGKEYFVERSGDKTDKGNVPVKVKFWTYDDDGNELLLNGEDRDGTNKIIRDYLGTYDDFVMTSLSTQYDNQSFVEKSQRERKDLLYKFLDISIYDELFRIAKEESREYQTLIREYDKENLHEKSSLLFTDIEKCERDLDWTTNKLQEIKEKIRSSTNQIIALNKSYVETGTKQHDLSLISSQILKQNELLGQCVAEIKGLKIGANKAVLEIQELEEKIIDFVPSLELDQKFKSISAELNEFYKTRALAERELDEARKKVEHLKTHEYDPNCEFCVKNPWVKDAIEIQNKLPKMEEEFVKGISMSVYVNEQLLKQLKEQLEIQNKGIQIQNQIQSLKSQLKGNEERQELLKYKGKTIQEQIVKLQLDEQEYHKQESILLKNQEILKEIDELTQSLKILEQEEKKYQDNYNKTFSKLTTNKKEYKTCQDKLKEYLTLVRKFRNYELYLQALSRDGVPYKILETVLPVIEYGVNEILNQVTNFTIKVESQDDKYIHAYIVHPERESYPVELTSGMERFIIALAFRTALNDITSLPKPNFLAIDEGFGVLDSENLSSLGRLFNYLKTQYEYLLCISHIDAMKDLVDKTINIEKINGFSRINVRT